MSSGAGNNKVIWEGTDAVQAPFSVWDALRPKINSGKAIIFIFPNLSKKDLQFLNIELTKIAKDKCVLIDVIQYGRDQEGTKIVTDRPSFGYTKESQKVTIHVYPKEYFRDSKDLEELLNTI